LRLFFAWSICLLFCSCIQSKVKRFAGYDQAQKTEQHGVTKVFFADEIDLRKLPSAVPFAVIGAAGDQTGPSAYASHMKAKGEELNADFVLIGDSSTYYAGSVSNYVGFGMSMSTPVYGLRMNGTAFRVCPGKLGLSWSHETHMVLTIENASVRSAGLLEGDTVLSLDGVAVEERPSSSFNLHRLEMQPGDEFKLVWIRPGTGRMEGVAVTMDNPPTHLQMTEPELAPPRDGRGRVRGTPINQINRD